MNKEIVFENVIKQSQTVLLSKISTVKLAYESGTSESNIFKTFKTKNNLFAETFVYIDKKVADRICERIKSLGTEEKSNIIEFGRIQWVTFVQFFNANKHYLTYYASYRGISSISPEYPHDMHMKNHEAMLAYLKSIDDEHSIFIDQGYEHYWNYLIDVTLFATKQIADGIVPSDEESLNRFYHVLFDGLFIQLGVLKLEQ